MESKLLLCDGHNLLFKAFFGLPREIPGANGCTVHGVVGFMGMLRKVCEVIKPTELKVVFDSETGSERRNAFADYKAQRLKDWSQIPRNPFMQLPGIRACLDQIGWAHCELPGVEADDVIATITRDWPKKHTVVILSTDADLLQLVSANVSLCSLRGQAVSLIRPEDVRSKYGVEPRQLIDYRALVGDKSDNIAGVPGIGPRTAMTIIRQYDSLDKALQHPDFISSTVGQRIQSSLQTLTQARELIALDKVHVSWSCEDMAIKQGSWQWRTMDLMRETGLI